MPTGVLRCGPGPACEDCIGLVGAARHAEPHKGLRVSRLNQDRLVFNCLKCGSVWERRPLGWATLPHPLLIRAEQVYLLPWPARRTDGAT
jgi:hypothetical protein